MESSLFSAPADVPAGLREHATHACIRRVRNGMDHPERPSCTNRCSTGSCREPCIGTADGCTASLSSHESWLHPVSGRRIPPGTLEIPSPSVVGGREAPLVNGKQITCRFAPKKQAHDTAPRSARGYAVVALYRRR